MKTISSAIGIVISSVLVLSGCSPSDSTVGDSSTPPRVTAAAAAGWKDEFADASRRARTDFERSALADGRITDAEFSEMENGFAGCLRDHNVTFDGFGVGGGYGFTPRTGTTTEEANSIADDCSARSGLDTVGYLYFAMQRNPQNLDEATITAACLVKKKVVPPSYSARDYSRDAPTQAFPFSDKTSGDKALEQCSTDPLGLLERRER